MFYLVHQFDYINYIFFIINSIIIYYLYKIFHLHLLKYDDYKMIDANKKLYIIKNFIKSGAMVLIIGFLYLNDFNNVINNTLNDEKFKWYGGLYVSNDFMGLIMVQKLPNNTKFHHIVCVVLFTIFCFISDISNNRFAKCIIYYTIFSCHAFLVNMYLALRFFYKPSTKNKLNKSIDIIRISSYYIYLGSLMINILYQLYILLPVFYNNYYEKLDIIYCFLLIPIIKDDLILLEWLKNKKLTL